MRHFVIIGSGLAGHNAALHLRKLAPTSRVTLVGQESGLPYDRPPLTKDFLRGKVQREELVLRHAQNYTELGIDYRPATTITAIDRDAQRAVAADGTPFPYDALMIATGSRPKRLPLDCNGVLLRYLRTLADAVDLRGELLPGRRIAIIGGGFIGLEVAASAATAGCRVIVIEAGATLLSRGMPLLVGSFVQRLHETNGVQVILNAALTDIIDSGSGYRLSFSARAIEADCIVVGIGVVPNVELAADSGLAVDDGIVVDRYCRTSDSAIYAAGEVTAHPPGGRGIAMRFESWQVAAKQSLVAAACMAGFAEVFDDPPWLWSDQFDVNLQSIGLPGTALRYLFRQVPERRGWTLLGVGADDMPVGAVAVNNGRDISMLRQSLRLGEPLPALLKGAFGPVPERIWELGSLQ
jgi:NADPH-dependent 2,4-dienoyl-CoA reductase/sulfur reductase-like enzyme